ncbi:hypothetical protein AAY473_010190 [Plecturocebus cupreus]
MGSCYFAWADLKPLASSNSPASASQSGGTTGVRHHTWQPTTTSSRTIRFSLFTILGTIVMNYLFKALLHQRIVKQYVDMDNLDSAPAQKVKKDTKIDRLMLFIILDISASILEQFAGVKESSEISTTNFKAPKSCISGGESGSNTRGAVFQRDCKDVIFVISQTFTRLLSLVRLLVCAPSCLFRYTLLRSGKDLRQLLCATHQYSPVLDTRINEA